MNSVFFVTNCKGAINCAPTILGFYLFSLATYLFIRICDVIPWYGLNQPDGKRLGIRVHFQKALVPTSYILFVASTVCLIGAQTGTRQVGAQLIAPLQLTIVIVADLCMLIVASVNGILIYFHLRDRETLPVNYFSLNKYLRNEG